jgi:hypothetical protein
MRRFLFKTANTSWLVGGTTPSHTTAALSKQRTNGSVKNEAIAKWETDTFESRSSWKNRRNSVLELLASYRLECQIRWVVRVHEGAGTNFVVYVTKNDTISNRPLKGKKKTYSRFKVEHSINGARGEMTLKPFESKGVSNTRRRTYCQCEPQVFAGLRDDKNPDGREDLVLRPYQSSQSNGLAQR